MRFNSLKNAGVSFDKGNKKTLSGMLCRRSQKRNIGLKFDSSCLIGPIVCFFVEVITAYNITVAKVL